MRMARVIVEVDNHRQVLWIVVLAVTPVVGTLIAQKSVVIECPRVVCSLILIDNGNGWVWLFGLFAVGWCAVFGSEVAGELPGGTVGHGGDGGGGGGGGLSRGGKGVKRCHV